MVSICALELTCHTTGVSHCFLIRPQQGKEIQLLHVFEEDLILGNEKKDDSSQDLPPAENGREPLRNSI